MYFNLSDSIFFTVLYYVALFCFALCRLLQPQKKSDVLPLITYLLHIHVFSIFPSAVLCFVITVCWWVIVLLPLILLYGRYFYSRRMIHRYLEQASSRDMGDIQGFYMKSSISFYNV